MGFHHKYFSTSFLRRIKKFSRKFFLEYSQGGLTMKALSLEFLSNIYVNGKCKFLLYVSICDSSDMWVFSVVHKFSVIQGTLIIIVMI